MWNDLQTDNEEGQEEELQVIDDSKTGKSKQPLPPFLWDIFLILTAEVTILLNVASNLTDVFTLFKRLPVLKDRTLLA